MLIFVTQDTYLRYVIDRKGQTPPSSEITVGTDRYIAEPILSTYVH